MKDNRWLEIDGDLLENALKANAKRKINVKRILIASIAAALSVSIALTFILVPFGDVIPNDESLIEDVDISGILATHSGIVKEWDGGKDLKLVALSSEKSYSTSGAKGNSSGNGSINQSIDVTLSSLPNVKLDSYTSGRYIDMTGNGEGRYDWDQAAVGIYYDVIEKKFFSLRDEIRFALAGEDYGLLEDEFVLLTACRAGSFRFSDDDYEHETIYFGMIEGKISYSDAIAALDSIPDGFGLTKAQEDSVRRYFRGEEINVAAEFPSEKDSQSQFNLNVMIEYHSLLERRCGNVRIHEFGTSDTKCFFTNEHWRSGGSGVFVCDFGIYDRETKEITLVTGEIDSSILFNLTHFGSEFCANENYTMLAYTDTSDGRLCLIDAVNEKFYSGMFSAFIEDNGLSDDSQISDELCEHSDLCNCSDEAIPEEEGYSSVIVTDSIGAIGKINFSPNDKFVYCKLNTEQEAWILLDTNGAFSKTVYGSLVKFVSGGHGIILENESGFHIFDVATMTELTAHYGVLYTLPEHETHAFFEKDNAIVRKNLINGEESVIATEYDAFLTDKNSGCVYVFTRSDKTVRGYSSADGECKYVSTVGDGFVNGAPENAIFNLLLDGSEKMLLISYYTPLSLEFDESKFTSLEGNYWDISGDVLSIPDFGYIYIRSIKYNGNYLDCYDSDDVNGEVDNINHIGRYLLLEDILSFVKDDMIIDYDELIQIGHLFAKKIEPYIDIDSMNRIKVIPEALTEFFGHELNTGEHFFWDIYLPSTKEYSVDCGKGYIANIVSVNVDRLSNGAESDEVKAFKEQLTKTLKNAYSSYLKDGYYRMKYEIKLQLRDRIESEYNKRFG